MLCAKPEAGPQNKLTIMALVRLKIAGLFRTEAGFASSCIGLTSQRRPEGGMEEASLLRSVRTFELGCGQLVVHAQSVFWGSCFPDTN